MKSNKLDYYLREGFSSIFTHGFMSFASVFIILACLIIMGSFSLLAINVDSIIKDFGSENTLLAYVDETYTEAQARGLEQAILAVPNVASVEFISREQAMEAFIGKYDDKSIFEGIDSSVFRHRFVVFVTDVELTAQTHQDVFEINGIDRVNANLTVARELVKVRNIVSGVSIVLVAILIVISLFIMSNTIKLATFERREEIAIMKMVGATNGFIRWPFVFEGFILGIAGALAAFIAQWGIYSLVTDKIVGGRDIGFISTIPFSHTVFPLLAVFVLIGFGVGVGGSVMAIRKYLKV